MVLGYRIITEYPALELESAWRRCLEQSDYVISYVAPEYFREPLLAGKTPFALLATSGPEILAVLTGIHAKGVIESGLAVRPQLCIRRDADLKAVTTVIRDGLEDLARQWQAKRMVLHTWSAELLPPGFRSSLNTDRTVLLDLKLGKDQIFKQFNDTSRNQIRKAIKLGVSVAEIDIEQDFDEFYALYRDWCSFKGLEPEPYEIRKASCRLRDTRMVLVAKYQNQIVGVSTFRYFGTGMMEYASNASRREETRFRQNDLLLWRAIEAACDRGLSAFSMGGSHFYLQKFGGKIHPTYCLSRDRTALKTYHSKEWILDRARNVYRRFRSLSAQNSAPRH
jgi:FemAB family